MAELLQFVSSVLSTVSETIDDKITTLKNAADTIGAKISSHNKFPNLILFKYTDATVTFDNICTRQSRGIIIDIDTRRIVSYPFDKFFNLGEKNAATIDWNDGVKVYEKLDGSLMTLYYYNNEWQVSSSGKPDASGPTSHDRTKTMANVFWEVWESLGYTLPQGQASQDYCYVFEMLSDLNKFVVRHKVSDLYLIGVRNLTTLKEHDINETCGVLNLNFKCVTTHQVTPSIESITEFINKRCASEHEGIVVCDNNFNRLKFKSLEYITIFYSLNNIKNRPNLVEEKFYELLVRNNYNNASELIATFPQFKSIVSEVKNTIASVCQAIQNDYDAMSDTTDQKEFAVLAKTTKYPSALFLLKLNKIKNPLEWLARMKYTQVKNFL